MKSWFPDHLCVGTLIAVPLIIVFVLALIPIAQRRLWPAPAQKEPLGESTQSSDLRVERINTLSHAARTTWLALLSYLAFIGVTLAGVGDEDFFLPNSQSMLPLIGVSVPTIQVFIFGPALAVVIFAYLHNHLMSLWHELGAAHQSPDTLPHSDRISPWLINEMALAMRADRALRRQPMRGLATIGTFALVFLTTPTVLAAFWLRSMPAHNEAITVFAVGIPFSLSIYWSSPGFVDGYGL